MSRYDRYTGDWTDEWFAEQERQSDPLRFTMNTMRLPVRQSTLELINSICAEQRRTYHRNLADAHMRSLKCCLDYARAARKAEAKRDVRLWARRAMGHWRERKMLLAKHEKEMRRYR